MMNIFSEGKCKAISQTLLDCGKILLAALVAADFIKFAISVLILGILIQPDENKGE